MNEITVNIISILRLRTYTSLPAAFYSLFVQPVQKNKQTSPNDFYLIKHGQLYTLFIPKAFVNERAIEN